MPTLSVKDIRNNEGTTAAQLEVRSVPRTDLPTVASTKV